MAQYGGQGGWLGVEVVGEMEMGFVDCMNLEVFLFKGKQEADYVV
jgi:hypothetical protein